MATMLERFGQATGLSTPPRLPPRLPSRGSAVVARATSRVAQVVPPADDPLVGLFAKEMAARGWESGDPLGQLAATVVDILRAAADTDPQRTIDMILGPGRGRAIGGAR